MRINDVKNRDWEDIASFSYNGNAWLAIADIGDNESRHRQLHIYVVAEPLPGDADTEIAWRVTFTYPDGARDAESMAVDSDDAHIYILSKRDVPAVLYQLPLAPPADEAVVATRLGEVASLPQPGQEQLKDADSQWLGLAANGDGLCAGWQRRTHPDLCRRLLLCTQRAQQSWLDSLQGQALELQLGKYKDAESIAFAADGQAAFVTVEKETCAAVAGRPQLCRQKQHSIAGCGDKKKANLAVGLSDIAGLSPS